MIRRANEADLEGILKLQAANQRSAGGSLSASISPANLLEMVRTMPVIVALASDKVVGFLIISTAAMNAGLPIIQDMLRAYPIDAETFISGPICISADMRGKGIAKELFRELGRIQSRNSMHLLHPARQLLLLASTHQNRLEGNGAFHLQPDRSRHPHLYGLIHSLINNYESGAAQRQ